MDNPESPEDFVADLALAHGLAQQPFLDAYRAVGQALEQAFGGCDSGIGEDGADFWIKIDGVEYRLKLAKLTS